MHMCCVLWGLTLWPPWTTLCQAPLSMGFSRQEYWNGLPFLSPGDLPHSGIQPGSAALLADSLPSEPQGSPLRVIEVCKNHESFYWFIDIWLPFSWKPSIPYNIISLQHSHHTCLAILYCLDGPEHPHFHKAPSAFLTCSSSWELPKKEGIWAYIVKDPSRYGSYA